MSAQTAADRLEAFVRRRFQVPDNDPEFTRDANLWEQGYVDSTGLVELLAFLEETFGVRIPDELLFSPDFASINGIAACLARLQGPSAGRPDQPR